MCPAGDERTRRELIGGGLALAAASLLAGAPPAAAAAAGDAELLLPVLGAELLAVFSYRTILHSQLMSPYAQRLASRILAQEHEHVQTMTTALERLGGTAPAPLKTVAAADIVLAAHQIPNRLAHLRTERDCLTILVRVESVLAGVYYNAILGLQDPYLLANCAQVLASEAQHVSVLNLALRPRDMYRAVPSYYVQ